MTTLAGWGRYPRHETEAVRIAAPEELARTVPRLNAFVPRGCGRAYGDAALGLTQTVMTERLDRFRGFDPATGELTVEAGVTLAEIIRVMLPRGFFPAVVPGTQQVTVGGMIASDVHGKNHHRDGGFGAHVEALTLLLPDGRALPCSREENAALFAATTGGMGLTGVILDATIRLRPVETGWIRQETTVASDLTKLMAALEASGDATYSVAWIDCSHGASLGRGLIYRGEHARREEVAAAGRDIRPQVRSGARRVPLDLPAWTLNRASIGAFNALYYRRGAAQAGAPQLVPWRSHFFPLDGLADWNRLYGKRGFVQHQCVLPAAAATPVLAEILERVSRLGTASPLAVLKQLGPANDSPLSFPMAGYTLALDLPATPATFRVLNEIDPVVVAAGGRLYLAKDARQSRATFEAGYACLPAFRALRRDLGLDGRVTSRLSARLGI